MIKVSKQVADEEGWIFHVEVAEGAGKTEHTVSLPRPYYEKLTKGNKLPPDTLVERSFEFLLSKEPKESILASFTLSDIATYFRDYENEIIS